MLCDLIDRHMYELKFQVIGGRSLEEAAKAHGDYCEGMARMLASGRQAKRWRVYLRAFMGFGPRRTWDKFDELVNKSEAAGNPPARFEWLVSYQIIEALMRGHQFAVGTYSLDTGEEDGGDDDDDELVCA